MPVEPMGKFRGARQPGLEYFDDIMGDNEEAGIFNNTHGEGISDFERVKVQRSRGGIVANVPMRDQSGRADLVVTWGELFVISKAPQTGVLPPGWRRSEENRSAYPECYPALQVSPDWAEKELAAAMRSGLIQQQDLAQDASVQQLNQFLQTRSAR